MKNAVEARIRRVTGVLDEQVDGAHVALGRKTLLDPYAFAMVRWLKNLEGGLEQWPSLHAFMSRMHDDEGVQRALAREKSGD